MFKQLTAVAALVIGLGSPAIAATPDVLTYDGNSKIEFAEIQFTFLKNGNSINAGVERQACYGGYANKYTVFADASINNKVVSATPQEITLLKEVCKNNPPVGRSAGGYFLNRNNLWSK